MMGTEKLDKRLVCTALVSVLLSLLLALTPVLAVAEPANGGSASADAAEVALMEDDAPEVAEDISDDAESTQVEPSAPADEETIAPNAASEPDTATEALTIAPATSTSLVTVPATKTSVSTIPYTASVTYDPDFIKGAPTRFTYNISGNTKPLMYRLNSLYIWAGGSWSQVIDISRAEASDYSEQNYFETAFYLPGTYKLSFYAAEYTLLDNGNKLTETYGRFEITFTIAESADFKSMDTVIDDVVAQCNQECAEKGDTSDYAKALWLNDWVIDNTEYDNSLTYMSAEGVFGRGLGTCEAYHDAYVQLLNKVGIETRRVDSTGDAHVWTGAKLDGKWYNIDATWNDVDYTFGGIDLRHLYFALPTDIMRLVHTNWDGDYSLENDDRDRAVFDAESYEDNYFIKSGDISKFAAPYFEASGTYSVRPHLDAQETNFTIPVVNNGWPDGYKNVIYNLVAYRLGQENWGSGIKVGVTYADNTLSFQATYNGSEPSISIDDAVISNVANRSYTGSPLTPRPTVAVGSTTLREGTDYFLSYANNTNVGTATITIKGAGNYTGTVTKTFAITLRSVSDAKVTGVANQTFTGSPLTPKPTVKVGATTLREGTDYTLSYQNNVNAGTATVTIRGAGNYTGTITEKFTIRPINIPASAVGSVANQSYTGKALTPKPTVKMGSTTLREGIDYTLSYQNNVNAGTASVIITGRGNYTGSTTKTFTIAKRTISGATVSVATQTYTGKALTPKPTVKVGSTTLREGTDYTLSYASNVSVGTATVTITAKGNYTGSRKAIFKIEAQPAGQQSAVTGSWVYAGRWWFSYDAATQRARGKRYPAGEWVTIGGKRYHFDAGGWMHAGWLQLGGKWHWLSSDGAMRTGWHLLGSTWYYMGTDGVMWTGKQRIGNATYFLDSSGAMRTGWNLEGSTWYYYGPSGAMAYGWRNLGGTWYFLDRSTGAMRQYWLEPGDGQRYFLLSSGAMVTGWARIDGAWYYFGPSGAMQKSRWVGNYYVGADGKMATSTWVDNGKYYVDGSGLWVPGKRR